MYGNDVVTVDDFEEGFMKEIKRESLKNIKGSTDVAFGDGGEYIDAIPDEIKEGLQFWESNVYSGLYATTYRGVVVYDGQFACTPTLDTAYGIVNGVEYGWTTDRSLYNDD